MNPALILPIISLIETIIQDTPQAIALFQTVKTVMTQGSDPTPEQWAALLTAMAAAHTKVQAA